MKKELFVMFFGLLLSSFVYSQTTDSLMKLGYELQNCSKYSEAVELYNSILTNDANNPNAMYQKALCFMRIHKAKEALEVFLKLIDTQPDFIGGVYGAATACVALKKWDTGMDYINIAIVAEPENAEYYMIRGQIYLKLKEKKRACKDFKKAKKLGSYDAKITMKINC